MFRKPQFVYRTPPATAKEYADNDFSFGSDQLDSTALFNFVAANQPYREDSEPTAIFSPVDAQLFEDSDASKECAKNADVVDDDAEEGSSLTSSSDELAFLPAITATDLNQTRLALIDRFPQHKAQINALAYKAGLYIPVEFTAHDPTFSRFFGMQDIPLNALPAEIVEFSFALEEYVTQNLSFQTHSKRG